MVYIPVAVEMYSVRKEFAANPLATMKALKEMGYEGVEFAGAPQFSGDFYAALLKESGLVCCGWHTPWDSVQPDKIEETIKLNQAVGNKYLIIPGIGASTHEEWADLGRQMNAVADKLAQYGMRTGYHNHDRDFKPLDGDRFSGNKPFLATLTATARLPVLISLHSTTSCSATRRTSSTS